MSDTLTQPFDQAAFRQQLLDMLYQVLPRQWPLKDFVHLNLLEGFQHLPFAEAVASARHHRGASGYLPAERYRELYRNGRISRDDLVAVVHEMTGDLATQNLVQTATGAINHADVQIAVLANDLPTLTPAELDWQMDEKGALLQVQPGVDAAYRTRLMQLHGSEAAGLEALWRAALERLGLQHYEAHAEELISLGQVQLSQLGDDGAAPVQSDAGLLLHSTMRRSTIGKIQGLLDRVGKDITMRGLLRELTGSDILEDIRPLLVTRLSAFLDQGMAPWRAGGREQGLCAQWRSNAAEDLAWLIEDLPEWRDELDMLTDDPWQTLEGELQRLGVPQEKWLRYLQLLALELPGWSGMVLWLHQRPGYVDSPVRVEMVEYLALRLVLERIFAQRLCRRLWRVEASLDTLRWYFRRRRSEFFVRHALYGHGLPEYLVAAAQHIASQYSEGPDEYDRWKRLADMVWLWQKNPLAATGGGHTVSGTGWQLFLLAQHLGLSPAEIGTVSDASLQQILAVLTQDEDVTGYIWLQAYERNYAEQVFTALAANHGRGQWACREQRPQAQLVFCMDDREEGIRRHLEERVPAIETFGAAGFFGVPINWRGLDDTKLSALCPIVVVPSHEIHEVAAATASELYQAHQQRRRRRINLKRSIQQEQRRSLFGAALLTLASAPLLLLAMAGKLLLPRMSGQWAERVRRRIDRVVPSRVQITATDDTPASAAQPRLGFTDVEQANAVFSFLRNIGLHHGFSPLVVMVGHGSSSENNPHRAAYDCGACSGRHGGPNARVFAAMANRPEVRALLQERGLHIPADTYFLGAFHDTCSEAIQWYDSDLLPASHREAFAVLQAGLDEARALSAYERCRRLPGAQAQNTPFKALRHVEARAFDIAQPRAEFGHATNATAFVGRRAMSRGAFFDRRAFLISYDPLQDPEGTVLETLLLANVPVGAGINLDYYFSAVDNNGYGSGSKITHNVSGLFGVMHGASDDLRTGLPKQGVDYHEPMRLLAVVEHRLEVLTRIYERQPSLQEFIGNGWVLLAAKDPASPVIHRFLPQRGWVRWEGGSELPLVEDSVQWFRGRYQPLAPVLTRRAAVAGGEA